METFDPGWWNETHPSDFFKLSQWSELTFNLEKGVDDGVVERSVKGLRNRAQLPQT